MARKRARHGDGVLAPLELPGAGRTQDRVGVVVRFGHEPRQGDLARVDAQQIRGARVLHEHTQRHGAADAAAIRRVLHQHPRGARALAAAGYDLGVAITGRECLGITVIVTEGFGDIAMAERTYSMLQEFEGQEASVNGATQIRAGVMRPEIIVPLQSAPTEDKDKKFEEGQLETGRQLRVIRDPWFGMIGTVSGLPAEPHVLGSGSKARVLEVTFPSGEKAIVPRANVELIEE